MNLSMNQRFRLAATAALVLGAAVNANAWIINFAGKNTAGPHIGLNYEFSDLFAGPFSVNEASNATITSGVATFSTMTQSLVLDWSGTMLTNGGTISLDGTWVLASEVGLNVASTGTYSASFDNLYTLGQSGNYSWSYVGTVPEPAPFAAMGIGIIGLCVSRRRKLRG